MTSLGRKIRSCGSRARWDGGTRDEHLRPLERSSSVLRNDRQGHPAHPFLYEVAGRRAPYIGAARRRGDPRSATRTAPGTTARAERPTMNKKNIGTNINDTWKPTRSIFCRATFVCNFH